MKPQDRLADALWEAERHQRTLAEALAEWDSAPAADWQSLETHRAKVRLVPATLAALNEPYEDWPMRDRLNRLEKLRYLDVDSWLGWREVRNRLEAAGLAEPATI